MRITRRKCEKALHTITAQEHEAVITGALGLPPIGASSGYGTEERTVQISPWHNALMLIRIIDSLALIALITTWCWWGYRTFRALWRGGETAWSRLVYGYGARSFAVVMTVILSAYAGYYGWSLPTSSIGYHFTFTVAGAAFGAIFAFPVGLGIGWFWGTIMAAILGLEPDKAAKSEKVTHE